MNLPLDQSELHHSLLIQIIKRILSKQMHCERQDQSENRKLHFTYCVLLVKKTQASEKIVWFSVMQGALTA